MRMSQLFVRWRFEALGCLAFLVWWNPWLTAADHGAAVLPTVGRIERLDPRLDALVPPDAAIEVLAMGFAWSEGPVWVADDRGGLPAGFTGPAAYGWERGSNGLALDHQGRLLSCEPVTGG